MLQKSSLKYLLIPAIILVALLDISGVFQSRAPQSTVMKSPLAPEQISQTPDKQTSAPLSAQDMVPHKAIYEIKMVSKRSGSQILNISGQMFFEWDLSCEAWIADHRFNLLYEYADGQPARIVSDFSTYEAFEGDSFDYSTRRKRNGELYEELRGHAQKDAKAHYTIPEDLSFDLPTGTLFPMNHTRTLLQRAQNGDKFFNAVIFDGSDQDGPVEINAFIGKRFPNADHLDILKSDKLDSALLSGPAWQIRMAFFPLHKDEAAADYEMNITFHENGIISDMLVEYDDFSVTQKLVALEKHDPDTSCNGPDKNNPL